MSDELEQQFSHLPQPYRMICKIIELEIIDSAWLIITRKHPELLLGSDGKPISIKRNHMLHNMFIPKQPPISPCRQWTSMQEVAKIIFGTTLAGKLTAIDSYSSILLSSVNIYPDACDEYFSPPWIADSAQNMETMVVTVCTGVIYQQIEEVQATEQPAAGGKKGGGKKGAAVVTETKPEKKRKCLLTISSMTMGTGTVLSPGSLEVVDTITLDLQGDEDDRSIVVDIFTAENIVAVTTSHGGCTVYPLPLLSSIMAEAGGGGGGGGESEENKTGDATNFPKYVSSMTVADFFGGRKLQGVSFAASTDEHLPAIVRRAAASAQPPASNNNDPHHQHVGSSHASLGKSLGHSHSHSSHNLTGHHGTNAAAAVPKPTEQDKAKMIENLPITQLINLLGVSSKELVVFYKQSAEWSLVDLHKPKPRKAAPATTAAAPAAAPAKGGGKGKKVEEVVVEAPPTNPNGLQPAIIGTWRLSAPVTQYRVDERRVTMLLGLADGAVSLWDIRSRTIVSVLCQHLAPVTSLCFSSNPSSMKQNRIICSGSADGILCFHSVGSNLSAEHENKTASSLEDPRYSANGLTFRNDLADRNASNRAVVRITTAPAAMGNYKYPLLLVCYADETVALYDYESAQLLGQLKYCIQRSLTEPAWHPATMRDITAVALMREDEVEEAHKLSDESIAEGDDEENENDDDKGNAGITESATRTRIRTYAAQYKLSSISNRGTEEADVTAEEGTPNKIPADDPNALNAGDENKDKTANGDNERQFPPLCCLSNRGICAIYVNDNRDINDFIDIRMDDIVLQSYPCLQTVCADDKRENLPKYFSQLSLEERHAPALPRERISEILGIVDDRFPAKPGGKGKKGTAPHNRASANTVGSAAGSNLSVTNKLSKVGTNGTGLDLSATSLSGGVSHLPIKQWSGEGKELMDDERPLSARSNDSSISAFGVSKFGAMDIDTAEYGDYSFQFDPIHAARRAAGLNKHNRLIANVGAHSKHSNNNAGKHTGGLTSKSSILTNAGATSVKSATAKTATTAGVKGKNTDPVLSLLNGLVDRFK